MDYETLSALNPRLIYCRISGYGRDGPLGKEPGYDVMLQAFSGMISTMGEAGGRFTRQLSPVDIGTGMFGLSGVLAAIIERARTGKGVYVELLADGYGARVHDLYGPKLLDVRRETPDHGDGTPDDVPLPGLRSRRRSHDARCGQRRTVEALLLRGWPGRLHRPP